MFRSTLTTAALVRSLLVGTATTFALAGVSATLVGCKDESQPDYWVEKLEDAKWKPQAVKRLQQFFEDAATRSNNDLTNPEVKALLDKIIGPLTNTYVSGYEELDGKTRVTLIKLLADFRDPRAEPALKKAFEEFAKRPRESKDDADIKWAIRAQTDLKLPGLAGPVLEAFQKLKASTMLGGVTYKDYTDGMVKTADKSWVGPLIKMLEPDIVRPQSAKDKDKIDDLKNQQFWQITAAQVLGELKDPQAVEPLMKMVLDPSKVDGHATAVLALVKIGKPSVDAALKLLADEDTKLKEHHFVKVQAATKAKKPPEDAPHVRMAAIILGAIGNTAAASQMIAVLGKTESLPQKAVIAREIARLPPTAETKKAFQEAFAAMKSDTAIPETSGNALATLCEASSLFYDPAMSEWLLQSVDALKGADEDKKAIQAVAITTATKLMKPAQAKTVNDFVQKWGTQIEKDNYKLAENVVKSCQENVACYLTQVEKSENQDNKTQFAGITAAYLIGVYGDAKSADAIIERLGSIDNAAVRHVASQTIDYLSPQGSTAAADIIEKIIDKNVQSADSAKIQADNTLKQVMYRIRSRAGG